MAARSCSHGSSGGSEPTLSRNNETNRWRQSWAKRGLPVAFASPSVVAPFSPRFKIVSSMPGMETGAPDRTLTISGSSASPKRRPDSSSTRCICARSAASSPAGQSPARNLRHASVETTKPGGTGSRSSEAITRRLAALPPISSRRSSGGSPCSWSRSKTKVILDPFARRNSGARLRSDP